MAQLINEAKRFQKLANIKEAEENQSMDSKAMMDAEKKAFQVANSSEFDTAMEKEWAKLSDEDKKKLAQSLSSLNEAIGSDFSSFRKIVQKAKDVEGINEDMSNVKAAVGNVLGSIGKINALSLFIPGALAITKAAGLGAFIGMAPAMLGSLTASMILWWLGKKIAGKEASEFIDETVNEALTKFRKGK